MPKVAIIILNWNGWKDTVKCLESLYQINYPNYDVIVVDNGSEDNSVQKIREYCEGKIKAESTFFEYNSNNKPIYVLEYTKEQAEIGGNFKRERYFSKLPSNRKLRLILNGKNYGFAGGNNVGIRYSLKALSPDYIMLLNNDTIAVDKEFLTKLVKVAESDEKVGFVGCKLIHPDGRNQYVGTYMVPYLHYWLYALYTKLRGCKLPTVKDIMQSNKILELDAVCGAAMLVRSEVIECIGLLDEGFFPGYHEETDWCYRGRMHGFKVIYNPDSVIVHHCSSSSKKLDNDYVYFVLEKNLLRLCLLNHPVSWLILEIPNHIIINFFYGIPNKRLRYLIKVYLDNLKNLKNIIRKRRNRKNYKN